MWLHNNKRFGTNDAEIIEKEYIYARDLGGHASLYIPLGL